MYYLTKMALMDVGRVCRKTSGRDAGKICVIVEGEEKGCVVVEGKDVNKSKVNVTHLEPTPIVLDIKKSAKKEKIVEELSKAGLA